MTRHRFIRLLYILLTIVLCMQLVMFVWNFTGSISNDFTGWRFAGDFLYPLMILCVFYFLRGLVGSLNKNVLFTEVNIRRLRCIGYCYLGYSL